MTNRDVTCITNLDIISAALRKIGMRNSRDPLSPQTDRDELMDGLEALFLMLDSFNREQLMIPYVTERTFNIRGGQRVYKYGPDAVQDFQAPLPLNILTAVWRSSGGTDYEVEKVGPFNYAQGNPFKETTYSRPYRFWHQQGFPNSTIHFDAYPLDTDKFVVWVLEPFEINSFPNKCCCDEPEASCCNTCGDEFCGPDDLDYRVTAPWPECNPACISSMIEQAKAQLEQDPCAGNLCDCSQDIEVSYTTESGEVVTGVVSTSKKARTAIKPWDPSFNQKIEFPYGYAEMLIYNLAVKLAPEYNLAEAPPAVVREAMQLKRNLKSTQRPMNEMRVDDALLWPRSRYNILSGPGVYGGGSR